MFFKQYIVELFFADDSKEFVKASFYIRVNTDNGRQWNILSEIYPIAFKSF